MPDSSDPRAALAAVLSQPGGREALRELLTGGDVLEATRVAVQSMRTTGERIPTSGAMALAALSAAVDALPSGRGPADRGEDAGEAGKGR